MTGHIFLYLTSYVSREIIEVMNIKLCISVFVFFNSDVSINIYLRY